MRLTGLIEFSTDGGGSLAWGQVWDTDSGSGWFNLWVAPMPAGAPTYDLSTDFVNGPNDVQAAICVDLREGENRFVLYGAPGTNPGTFALNLFFNGARAAPGISVYAPITTSNTNPPDFRANSSTTYTFGWGHVAGADTLTFFDRTGTVILTDYAWYAPEVHNKDRVAPTWVAADGKADFIGVFTLDYTPAPDVPEPATAVLVGLGLVLSAARRRRVKRSGT